MTIQERERDLVVATYGRSIWVTDVSPFAEMADGALDEPLHLFRTKPATLFKTRVTYGNSIEEVNGDLFFRADNPPDGAVMTYYIQAASPDEARIEIRDASGEVLRSLTGPGGAGLHRIVWDLETDETATRERPRRGGVTPSEWDYAQKVAPGRYSIRLQAGSAVAEGFVTVRRAPSRNGGKSVR